MLNIKLGLMLLYLTKNRDISSSSVGGLEKEGRIDFIHNSYIS